MGLLSAQRHITIQRPVREVFAGLEDFQSDHLWRAQVKEMRITSAHRTGLGASHIEVREMFGRTMESPASIVVYEPDKRFDVQRASGPIRPIASYRFADASGGTRLTLRLSVPLRGPSVLLAPIVALMVQLIARSIPADLERLKKLIESGGIAPAANHSEATQA